MVRPVADERDGLLAFLAQQRDALRFAVHGLTEEQARATPTTSSLSVGGLVKHIARVEHYWIVAVLSQRELEPEWRPTNWTDEYRLLPGETLVRALEIYATVAAETERIVAAIPDLGQPVPIPKGVPWFPKDVEAWSARWVLLHLIEETARHAGHADIIREALDGSSALQLMARAEGWEEVLKGWMSGTA
jgi:uncharacterized damage-inducible protein DinB